MLVQFLVVEKVVLEGEAEGLAVLCMVESDKTHPLTGQSKGTLHMA